MIFYTHGYMKKTKDMLYPIHTEHPDAYGKVTDKLTIVQEAKRYETLTRSLDDQVLFKLFLDKWNGQTQVVPALPGKQKIFFTFGDFDIL